MKELVTILIPVLNNPFSDSELAVLKHYQELLGDFPISFLTGESSPIQQSISDLFKQADRVQYDDRYFADKRAFTKLLFNQELYEQFSWSRFLLIASPETIVHQNELAYWCRQGYDLIQPAPHFEKKLSWKNQVLKRFAPDQFIQNFYQPVQGFDQKGGFSLRKVDTFAKKVKSKKKAIYRFLNQYPDFQNDNVFWEYYTNQFFPELLVPNPISRNRFVQSSTFANQTSQFSQPFATSG